MRDEEPFAHIPSIKPAFEEAHRGDSEQRKEAAEKEQQQREAHELERLKQERATPNPGMDYTPAGTTTPIVNTAENRIRELEARQQEMRNRKNIDDVQERMLEQIRDRKNKKGRKV